MSNIPLTEQTVEVEREIRQRSRLHPKWVADGRYKAETAEAKLAAMRAAHTTLMWLDANMAWIKPEAERRLADRNAASGRLRGAESDAAERESLRDDPAVAAVLEEFPGAEIAGIRDITPEPPQSHEAGA